MLSRRCRACFSALPAAMFGIAAMVACAVCSLGMSLAAEAAGVVLSSEADGPQRKPVQELRVVLVEAIDKPEGQAHAVLVGAVADAITAKFKATSPIFVDVSTLMRYAQEGCRRLQLVLWQEGVVLPGALNAGARQRHSVTFDLNYCRDGLPPASLAQ